MYQTKPMLEKGSFYFSTETNARGRDCFISQKKQMLEKGIVFMHQQKLMLEKGIAFSYQKQNDVIVGR